jgi:RNA polymerase subunit RPABC4/transcription elongation factor Spt4
MKTCRDCGGSYQDSSKICLICGEKLVTKESYTIEGNMDIDDNPSM